MERMFGKSEMIALVRKLIRRRDSLLEQDDGLMPRYDSLRLLGELKAYELMIRELIREFGLEEADLAGARAEGAGEGKERDGQP